MKKQFFYAALAIALMSSCSKDSDSGVVASTESTDSDLVAIQFGISTPAVTATTRSGKGYIGNDPSDTDTENEALWAGEHLGIKMYKRVGAGLTLCTTLEEATETVDGVEQKIFQDITFQAPTDASTGLVTMLNNGSIVTKYYPMNYSYAFYGYHFGMNGDNDAIDTDADGTNEYEATSEVDLSYNEANTIAYKELTIDGTQDIMIASTKAFTEEQNATIAELMADYSMSQDLLTFSALTARHGIQPILVFNHLLARLDFKVQNGSQNPSEPLVLDKTATTAGVAYDEAYPAGSGYPEADANGQITNAVFIKSLKIVNPIDQITVNVANLEEGGSTGIVAKSSSYVEGGENTYFTLMQKVEGDGLANVPMTELEPATAGNTTDIVRFGDGIMIVPDNYSSVQLEVELLQYVKKTETAWEWESFTTTATAKLTEGSVFEANKYYTITITTYGLQPIEVTAELTQWTNGGDATADTETDWLQ